MDTARYCGHLGDTSTGTKDTTRYHGHCPVPWTLGTLIIRYCLIKLGHGQITAHEAGTPNTSAKGKAGERMQAPPPEVRGCRRPPSHSSHAAYKQPLSLTYAHCRCVLSSAPPQQPARIAEPLTARPHSSLHVSLSPSLPTTTAACAFSLSPSLPATTAACAKR